MAHLSEGTLRRLFDDPDARSGADAQHYASCTTCQARYEALAEDARSAANLLAVGDLKVDVASAFQRVKTAPAAAPRFGFRLPVLRPATRPVLGAFAAAAVLVALFATGIAMDGLTVFQPKTVTVVPVTVGDFQQLSNLSAYGTVAWTTQPQPQLVTSAAEAATVSGLKVPVVGSLPAGVSTTVTYGALPQASAVFTFDAAKAAAEAAKTGKTLPAMPAGMDGSTLTVTVGPAVVEIFGNLQQPTGSTSDANQLNLPQLVVVASTAPLVTSTHVTVTQLKNFLLAQPGLSPALAAFIRSIGDPATTLPIPIPIQYATSQSVRVQGVNGVELGDNTGLGSAVIWVKNGVVYGIAGTVKQTDIVDIANHLT